MAKYEVFLPAAREGDFNLTLKVEAENWMAALKAGLKKLGEQGAQVANLLVDIMEDNSIHVTDSSSGRVFRIKELEEEAPAPIKLETPAPIPLKADLPGSDAPTPKDLPAIDLPPAPEPARPAPAKPAKPEKKAAPPPAPAPVEKPRPRPPERPAEKPQASHPPAEPPRARPTGEKPVAAPAAPHRSERPTVKEGAKPKPEKKPAPAPVPAVLRDTANALSVQQIDRPSQPVAGPIGRTRTQTSIEDVLSDLFERTQEAFGLEEKSGLGFLLDLALEKIPAESGSVFVADMAGNDLALSSARGPKAKELERLKLRMPVGVGIVGFCAQEAVSLAISDTEKDPRFFRNVSERLGYDTKSILCAPMVSGGRTFGCIEVINKKGTSHFSDTEVAILAYVAHQGAKYLEQLNG